MGAVSKAWDEAKHPRAHDGKFSHGGGVAPGVAASLHKVRRDANAADVRVVASQTGAMTDGQFQARAARVEHVINQARKTHATDVTHTLPGGAWTPERDAMHREIANAIYERNGHVPNERRAVVAGGLGGAGKTTVLTKHAGVDTSKYLTINPDDVKEELAKRGAIPEVPGAPDLSPMERSALVHEESSRIAGLVADRAMRDGKNIMHDITMSSGASVQKRVDALKRHGYRDINGVFVDIPTEVSVSRAMSRYRRGADKFHAGQGHGGRYVPPSVIRAQRTSTGSTINRDVFDQMRGQFANWSVYDNSVDGRAPQLIDRKGGTR